VAEFTGWRAWLVRHLPWYDEPMVEAKHAHDAQLRRSSSAQVDAILRQYHAAERRRRSR